MLTGMKQDLIEGASQDCTYFLGARGGGWGGGNGSNEQTYKQTTERKGKHVKMLTWSPPQSRRTGGYAGVQQLPGQQTPQGQRSAELA